MDERSLRRARTREPINRVTQLKTKRQNDHWLLVPIKRLELQCFSLLFLLIREDEENKL